MMLLASFLAGSFLNAVRPGSGFGRRSRNTTEDASSHSDLSGISNASNKTYINEHSSLVLETVEEGVTKFYPIPHDVAKAGKFKRKGVKLHIFMDHIFVAKHVKA